MSQGYYSFPWAGGVIFLDTFTPTTLTYTPPTNGVANLTFQIPNSPALIGFELYLQAIGDDLSLPGGFGLSNGLKLTVHK